MRKTRKWLVLVSASGALWAGQGIPAELNWHVTNQSPSYELSTSGDICIGDGASVTVARKDGAHDASGGAMASLDASRYAGKELTLTANVDTKGGASNAAIWIRSDGHAPEAHAFSTTERYPVRADAPAVVRSVRLTVPKDATYVAVGVALIGSGRVSVTRLTLSSADSSPVDAVTVFDQAIGTIREQALDGAGIDWDGFLKDAHAHLKSSQPSRAAYPYITAAIDRLHDGHSFFLGSDDAWASMTNDGTRSAIDVHYIYGGFGYVSLPGFSGPVDAQLRYVDTIATFIANASPMTAKGWIVDLRQDTGGNMWPMLGALHALLGDGVIGASQRPGRDGFEWHAGQSLPAGVKPVPDLSGVPVAVILGPHTSSAGEAVAVAFHGRPATRSFGVPTSGQASSNETGSLRDGSLLIIKAFTDVDRHGQVFTDKVIPDEQVEGDAVLSHATNWLSAQHPL